LASYSDALSIWTDEDGPSRCSAWWP